MPCFRPSRRRPSAMAPDDTRITRWPRLRSRSRSSIRVSSQVRLTRPVSPSTSSAEPTFTTMRRACVRGAAKSARRVFMKENYTQSSCVAQPDRSPYTYRRRMMTRVAFAVSRDYEPVPSQWYENVEEEESFRVLSVDEDSELIEIEYLDGDVEELDLEAWEEMDRERIEQPEGWSESDDEDEDDLDDDDDEDEDDVDEERDEY